MTASERTGWLTALEEQNPGVAGALRSALERHEQLVHEAFLESSPERPEGGTLAGCLIGPYKVISLIGHGGMGTVWMAERSDGRFQRRAAIKFLNVALVGGQHGEQRFRREGSILGRLTHPNIAQLVDAGVLSHGQPYLVLEYVEGETIDKYCDAEVLDVNARVRLFLDVLAAVAHAHANLIVHRDIKPPNVMVERDGKVKLLDFGIAKLMDDNASGAMTLTAEVGAAFSPLYAAPEQVTGGAIATTTDVYALGVLLYVILTGQHPTGVGAQSPAELIKRIVDFEPPLMSDVVRKNASEADATETAARRGTTPEKLVRQLLGDLDVIVAKALKKNPRERYESVVSMAGDLRRYLNHEPIRARPDTVRYRTAKFVRRNRTAVALAGVAFVAVIAGLVGISYQAQQTRAQRDFALRELARAEAVNDLDKFVLSDAAPSGKPFTVDDLLGRAAHIVARQQGDDASRAELMVSLGMQYASLDEDDKARRLLRTAFRLSRTIPDVSTRATTACAYAGSIARGGDINQAEQLYREAMNSLPDTREYVLDRVFCLRRAMTISALGGATEEAISRAKAAQDLLTQSPLRSDLLNVRVLMDLAESYRVAGQSAKAVSTSEQALEKLTTLGRDDTQTAGTLFNNWGLALWTMGRQLEAERILHRAIEISRVDQSGNAVSPMLQLNYARVLRELGRLDEAAAYAERAFAKAQQTKDPVILNQVQLELSRIYRQQHALKRAGEMLAEVEPRLRKALPPGHFAFAVLATEQGALAEAAGDLQTALTKLNQAEAITQAAVKAGHQGRDNLTFVFLRRSDVELKLGRANDAATDASRALEVIAGNLLPGSYSSFAGRAYYALGEAQLAQGKRDEARASFDSATEHFEKTLGADGPLTRDARRLRDENSPSR